MSTRSGACVWWSNARDRADRGGLPRRGVTSRNYTGSLLVPSGGREVGLAPLDDAAAVAGSTSGISWGPFPGGSGRGNRGSWGFSLESFAGAFPPPRGNGKSPGNSQGFCRVPRFAALDLGASRNLQAPFTRSILCTLADAGATWASSALLQHIFTIFGGDEYMFGKKVFAAMLATVLGASLFGANAAKAQINLDADEKPAVIYATETLATAVEGHGDYYVVEADGNNLNVQSMVGLGGPSGTFVTVRFDLGGMVFNTTPSLAIADNHGTASLRIGGNAGDAFVSFIASRTDATAAAAVATLTVADFGVKPGVNGSVTITVTDSVGDDAEYTAKYDSAVRTSRALQEMPMPMDLEATVEQRFQMFGTETMGTLGSFMVGVNDEYLDADGGQEVVTTDIYADAESSVTISGDFSFASTAWLDDSMACDEPSPTDLLQRDDDMVMDELTEQLPSAFDTAMYLCISVPTGDDAVAIPATDPYIVNTEYAGGTPMAGWPANDGEHALGSITRDGTTVHIPYLTTWADYNQRIVVSNRSANEASYWITFRPEEGVMATPGMYAMGTLDPKSTIVLKAMDVVTLEGRTRTAATFVAEAKATQVDVATVIVNMVTGSTDTVNYDSD